MNTQLTNQLQKLSSLGQKWIVDESPTDNQYFEFSDVTPIFKLVLTPDAESEYLGEDPDIEILLFEDIDDAYSLVSEAIKKFENGFNNNFDYCEGLCYGIYKVDQGYILTWHDTSLDFGGNIIHYTYRDGTTSSTDEHKLLYNKAISEYSDCHFSQNNVENSPSFLRPLIRLIIALIKDD